MEKRKVHYEMKLLSSLVKVFPDEMPLYQPECLKLSVLWGESVSFQAAYFTDSPRRELLRLTLESPIRDYISVRSVELVPVGRAVHGEVDDNYLKTTAGLYPDLLRKLENDSVIASSMQWRSLWIDVEGSQEIPAGSYPIRIYLSDEDGVVCEAVMNVMIIGAVLPESGLIHSEWLHGDCLADYYQEPVFSEKYWQILENFLTEYVARGCNMILTPIFTPPLDTAVGGERTTIQLVDVQVQDQTYLFGFERFERFVRLCRKLGIQYFEISHLFTQWGAKAAPKIIATVDGKEKRIFGWDTPAVGEYTRFLEAFLPCLKQKLEELQIEEVTCFHISDEPEEEDLESYRAAKESVRKLLEGFPHMDALSNYAFYEQGIVELPVVATDHIQKFLDHGVPGLWSYYCAGQYRDVSNRYIAMPSARNRIYGLQIYKYGIAGILHWGYNFYNSEKSLSHINPYEVTDAGYGFEAGDSFLVYPGKDFKPEESIRMMVLYHALNDVRALRFLESLTDREFVMELMESEIASPITFTEYPKSDFYLLQLRERVNREIGRRI